MQTLSQRIREVIHATGLSQTAFSERIRVSQAFLSQVCSGARQPSDRTLLDICREFKVSERWLRTGEGEMFVHPSREEEIAAFMGDVLAGEKDDFRMRLIHVLSLLEPADWAFLEKRVQELMALYQENAQEKKLEP